jgi:hypothetical protein
MELGQLAQFLLVECPLEGAGQRLPGFRLGEAHLVHLEDLAVVATVQEPGGDVVENPPRLLLLAVLSYVPGRRRASCYR